MSPWILGGKERPRIRLDRGCVCLSLPSIKERLHWVLREQQWPGVKERVSASSCLSEVGKLRVAEKQQVRGGWWGCITSQRHAAS